MTYLKIKSGKLQFVRNNGFSFCFPFVFSSDLDGNYTIEGVSNSMKFVENIENFLDEEGNPIWAGEPAALDSFLATYSAVPQDTNTVDTIYEIDNTIREMLVSPNSMQVFDWQDNVQDIKQVSTGAASLLGYRLHNKAATAKTFRFYDVAALPILAGTKPKYQITIAAGAQAIHSFNGHLISKFTQKMYVTVHDDDVYATNTYTPTGTGYTVAVDWASS